MITYINKLKTYFIYFFLKWIQNKVLIAKLSIIWYKFLQLNKKKRWGDSLTPQVSTLQNRAQVSKG